LYAKKGLKNLFTKMFSSTIANYFVGLLVN